MDNRELDLELDRVKSQVFKGKTAAFLGSLMCNLDFVWDSERPTAATDGHTLWWNPDWFMSLKPEVRRTILVHELWHPARLHALRRGTRDPKIWNQACDYKINGELIKEGYSFEGIEWGCIDPKYDGWVEEDIYDDLIKNKNPPPPMPGPFGQDMEEPAKLQPHVLIANVVKAIQQAKMSGQAGSIPGEIEKVIDKFLAPIIPWEIELQKFFSDLLEEDYTWARPNRRYQDIYLPSKFTDDGRLEHLCYYIDVSGSCDDNDVRRFNSEVKYIKETLKPEKLTVVQFTTVIVHEQVFKMDDPFETIIRYGNGGTSLVPVRDHMIKHNPTAAVIFSDLQCPTMQKLPIEVPTIWVAIRAAGKRVPFGRVIYIQG